MERRVSDVGNDYCNVPQDARGGFTGDLAFLSNFYQTPYPINAWGVDFLTAEHGFQWAKTPLSSDRGRILAAPTPGLAKKVGRSITLRENWEEIKLVCMETILRSKFRCNPDLAEKLMSCDESELVEWNTWNDKFWGCCSITGEGLNHLGLILKKIRLDMLLAIEGGGKI